MAFLERWISWLLPQSRFFGLSIGSSSVKWVELKKKGKKWQFVRFQSIPLPLEAVIQSQLINTVAVIESIQKIVDSAQIKSQAVCTSVGGSSLIVKKISLEKKSKKESKDSIQEQVLWESEQFIPFDLSEMALDFFILNSGKDSHVEALVVAVKRDQLENTMRCVEAGKLNPKVVDVDFFAMQNIYEANYSAQTSEAVALVDLGATSMKVVIVHQGIPLLTKESNLGSQLLTESIQKKLNLSFIDAEAMKVGISQGAPFPQELSEVLRESLSQWVEEFKKTLAYYQASSLGASVSYILLMGGGAKLPKISQVFEEGVRLPTQLLNPFQKITYDSSRFSELDLSQVAPLVAIPMGLALRSGVEI